MKNLSRLLCQAQLACSYRMNITFALLIGIMLPLMVATTSAQVQYFREYAPTATDATNYGRCIIRPAAGDDKLLSVGRYLEPGVPSSGHGIWTNKNGTLNAATIYNRIPNYDDGEYSLEFIEDNMVSAYDGASLEYTGHPATGNKIYGETIGGSVTLLKHTWTTIIDPTDRDRKWDNVITNANNDHSYGKCLVRDQTSTNDFFVLSNITNTDETNNRFGVTQYEWLGANTYHTQGWSYEYTLEGYQLYPAGIVQGNDYELVVAGTAVQNSNGRTRIFTCKIDHTNGNIPTFRIYEVLDPYELTPTSWNGKIVANSITGPYSEGHFLIAGKATRSVYESQIPQAIEFPMIVSIDSYLGVNSFNIYPFKINNLTGNYKNGEFNCAKELQHFYGPNSLNYTRVIAVGKLGDSATYPAVTAAFSMNASDLSSTGTGTPGWYILQGTDFTTGTSPTATTAKWVVSTPDTTPFPVGSTYKGEFIYTGEQSGGGITHAIQGAVKKLDGTSECYTVPYSDGVLRPEFELEYPTPDKTSWGTSVDDPTTMDDPALTPLQCTGGSTISAGKRGYIEEPLPGNSDFLNNIATIDISGDALNVMYISSENSSIKLVVVDLLGNRLVEQRVECSAGSHAYTIDTKDWITGSYFVSVISQTTQYNKSIVIVR